MSRSKFTWISKRNQMVFSLIVSVTVPVGVTFKQKLNHILLNARNAAIAGGIDLLYKMSCS